MASPPPAKAEFSKAEADYLGAHPLGRLATVSRDGKPDVAPVTFEFDGTYFYIGGRAMKMTRKYWNVKNGEKRVSFVVDDLATVNPWAPRAIKVDGTAELVEDSTEPGGPYLRITPLTHRSWGLA
jgi:pyridoxamine 5'-phosphate oxidase family protein